MSLRSIAITPCLIRRILRTAPRRVVIAVAIYTIAAVVIARNLLAADDSAPTPPSGPKYTLVYKFHSGEVVRTNVLQHVILDTTIQGTTQTAETTSVSVKVWKIKEIDADGHTHFEHSVDSVNMRQKVTGREEVAYNSQTDTQPPPAYADVARSIRVPLTEVTIDKTGKIIKRVEKRPGMPTEQQNSQMVIPLPSDPVSVGESWNVPVDIPIILEDGVIKVIKTRQHYTLEKVAHGVATISVATQVLTPVNNPKVQSQLIQRLTKGNIRFDIDAGHVLAQDIDLDEQVLGFQGADSSLHFLGHFTEEYVPAETKAAAKPKTTR